MKRILLFISLIWGVITSAQTSFTLVQKDTSGIDLVRAGTGLIQFNSNTPQVNNPDPAVNFVGTEKYFRLTWDELSKGFGGFDAFFNQAIDQGQKVNFRVVAADDSYGGNTVSGKAMAYPIAVHNAMQAETNPDYIVANLWFPNWNSPSFLAAWRALQITIRNHINAGSHNGHSYISVLWAMDIGGIGIYGEGHRFGAGAGGSWPTGTQWTLASLQEIVNAQTASQAFPDIPLIGDVNFLNSNSELPSGFGSWYLNGSNNWGAFGMRWDHAGNAGTHDFEYTNKTTVENGVNFKTEEGRRWKVAPVIGEPEQSGYSAAGQCDYYDVIRECIDFGASTVENVNIQSLGACTQNGFRSVSKRLGYRTTITSGLSDDSIHLNANYNIKVNIANIGIAPTYEKYNWTYELRQGSTVKWSGLSTFQLQFFLPGTFSQSDNFTIPSTLAVGSYDLYLVIRESGSYRVPMQLQLSTPARQVDGSYLLKSGIHVAVAGSTPPPPPPPPPNNPPTIFSGGDRTDSLPKNIDTLRGTASDIDGDAVTVVWTQLSGPNIATMSASTSLTNIISGLIAGSYRFRITGNDGKGGISTSDAVVTVFPANIPPTVKAGSDIFITSPQNRDTLRGIVTDANGDVFTVAWVQLSGPNTATMLTPTAVTNIITGLIVGTYSFKLTANDGKGGITSDTVNLFLAASAPPNVPPVVNAGNDILDTLPHSTATLTATATDANGDVMTYLWAQVSGPNTATMSASTSLINNLSGLIQGVYVFSFTANDGHSGITSDSIHVLVAAALLPPPPPVYNPPIISAGNDTTIYLTADSAFLHGVVTHSDTTIASYSWTKFSGPSVFTILSSTSLVTKVTGLIEGFYRFRLRVTDNAGNIVDSYKLITVQPVVPLPLPPPSTPPDPIKIVLKQ